MEEYSYEFDKRIIDPQRCTDDFTYVATDGTVFEGRDKALAKVKEVYAPFIAIAHIPFYLVCTEVSDGWEMLGQAHLFLDLPGNPAAGQAKVKDSRDGKEWDLKVPGAFKFHYVKHGGGILVKRTEVMGDNSVGMMMMLKRGLVNLKDLGL
jgi:hypothetical protein